MRNPNRLQGDEILLEARILAVSDVVESIASHRPYRPARGMDVALDEITTAPATCTIPTWCGRAWRYSKITGM